MAELVDALVLGTSGAIHGGSSPLPPILLRPKTFGLLRQGFEGRPFEAECENNSAKEDVWGFAEQARSRMLYEAKHVKYFA